MIADNMVNLWLFMDSKCMQCYEDLYNVACIYSDQKSPGQSGMFIILKTRKNLVEGVGVEIILKETTQIFC